MLLVHTCAIPLVVVAFIDEAWLCACFAYITVTVYWATNEVRACLVGLVGFDGASSA